MKVRYTPRARSDLQSMLQYIDERSPLGARNVKRSIQKKSANTRKVGDEQANKRAACSPQAAILI